MAAGVAFVVHLGSPVALSGFGGQLSDRSVCPGRRLVPVIGTLPKQTTAAFFYATASLLPAIDALFTHTIEACRGVDASPLRESCQDLHNNGHRRFQLGNGCMACFGKSTFTGGTMVHGPWCATFDGVRVLFLDVLPITIRASHLDECPGLPLTIRRFL